MKARGKRGGAEGRGRLVILTHPEQITFKKPNFRTRKGRNVRMSNIIPTPIKLDVRQLSNPGATLESETISDNWKTFKNDEKCFLSLPKGFFSFLGYSHFSPDVLIM